MNEFCHTGYLSMLLAEVIPRERMENIILVDRSWSLPSGESIIYVPHTHTYTQYRSISRICGYIHMCDMTHSYL